MDYSLEYASNELKNNKEIVLEAVKQNGYSLQYASNELKNDKEIVYYANEKNKLAFKECSYDIQKKYDNSDNLIRTLKYIIKKILIFLILNQIMIFIYKKMKKKIFND